MPTFIEREKTVGELQEVAEEISPLTIERKEVVQPSVSNFPHQVTDDHGQPLIATPKTQVITIELPENQTVLTEASKGSADDSRTWWGVYWLRLIKRAFKFGWQMIVGRK